MPRDAQVNTISQGVADTGAGDAVSPVSQEDGFNGRSFSEPEMWDGKCLIALNGLFRAMKEGVLVVADVDGAQLAEIRRELWFAEMALDEAFKRRGWDRSCMYSGHFERHTRRKRASAGRRRERVQ